MKRILYYRIKLKTVSLSHLKSASKSAQEEKKKEKEKKTCRRQLKSTPKGGHSISI